MIVLVRQDDVLVQQTMNVLAGCCFKLYVSVLLDSPGNFFEAEPVLKRIIRRREELV